MSEGTPYWPPSQQPGVHVDYNVTNEHSVPIWAQDSTPVLSGQPSPQDIFLPQCFTGPDEFPYEMDYEYSFSHGLADTEPADITNHIPFDENAHAQPGNGQVALSLDIPTYRAVGPPTSSTVTDQSPQFQELWTAEVFSNPELPSTKLAKTDQNLPPLSANEPSDSQDLWSSHFSINGIGSAPAPQPITDSFPESPVKPFARGQIVIPPAEDDLKSVVGSPQIQEAAGKRRTKPATYKCLRCAATFTARHNLRYHENSHMGLKPYKCGKCPYGAASPATMKRHQSTCKGTSHSTEGNA